MGSSTMHAMAGWMRIAWLVLVTPLSAAQEDSAAPLEEGLKLMKDAEEAIQKAMPDVARAKVAEALKVVAALKAPGAKAAEDLRGLHYDLARLAHRSGDMDLERRALQTLVSLLPEGHTLWSNAHAHLGDCLVALKDIEGAAVVWRKSHDVLSTTSPENASEVLLARQNLAATLFWLGNYEESTRLYQDVLEKLLLRHPPDVERIQMARGNLAMMQAISGDLDVARAIQRQVVEQFEK